ncbi:hypothetical protein DFP72DRAFT_423751 [Ephemerocybe angulata]|uniref:F-box domain-containing protein n=1 Tax=Ephemerocybe angulata TaxID=980116 RepID=A0A8H6MFR1_9AGAR|nr:hypothetical protein DFP72DRAFT_423751 [Tulosesus angulatus]
MAEETSVLYLSLDSKIYLLICSRLDPLDLLRLSQTCTKMHSLITQKPVWQQALKTTCFRNALFESSFPLDLMTIEDLKRAAAWTCPVAPDAPSRSISQLRNCEHASHRTVYKFAVRELLGTHWRVSHPWRPFPALHVESCNFAEGSWHCWSLVRDSIRNHVVLGVVYMKYDWHVIGISTPIRHERDSIRFVVGIGIPGSDIRLRVYEIGPIPKDCALDRSVET